MPLKVRHMDREYNIVMLEKPEEDYIIIEYLKEREEGEYYHIYLLSFGSESRITLVIL